MSTELSTTQTGTKSISQFLSQKNTLEKFSDILGEKAQGFIASVITAVNSNDLLKNATKESIYASALTAATLDLPVNANLGFAYFIPFNNKRENKQECQFQIGYKGFIQLAMRSGQFRTISATPIYTGQLVEENPLTGFAFDFTKKQDENIIGYAAYFALTNGFEKTLYMTKEELNQHGKNFSQTFKRGFGLWKDNFDAMAIKTVLKLLLSKYAPLSIEMQKAIIVDQAVIKDANTLDVSYIDNEPVRAVDIDRDREASRITEHINKASDIDELEMVAEFISESQRPLYETRKTELAA